MFSNFIYIFLLFSVYNSIVYYNYIKYIFSLNQRVSFKDKICVLLAFIPPPHPKSLHMVGIQCEWMVCREQQV